MGDDQFAVSDFFAQALGRKGAAEDDFMRILGDVDEAAAAGDAVFELADVDVAAQEFHHPLFRNGLLLPDRHELPDDARRKKGPAQPHRRKDEAEPGHYLRDPPPGIGRKQLYEFF